MLWHNLIRWSGLTAGVLSLAIGLWTTPWRRTVSAPPFQGALAGLASAPIPAGSIVLLVPPADTPGGERNFYAFEARWLRPDLRWLLPEHLSACAERGLAVGEVGFGVGVKPMAIPAGWTVLAEDACIVVARRSVGAEKP
jgi:hypothetical protein